MFELSADQQQEFRDAVALAAGREDVAAAIGGIYRELSGLIEERKPICRTSGRCCKFDEFGHRLFVTTAEMGAFRRELLVASCELLVKKEGTNSVFSLPLLATSNEQLATSHVSLPLLATSNYQLATSSCPYQSAGLCTVHTIRPFGCRIFFCDETSTQWQQDQYEIFHARLRKLHEELAVPYFYVEWRAALAAVGLPGK